MAQEPTPESWEAVRNKLSGNLIAGTGGGNLTAGQNLVNRFMQIDPDVSTTGIPKFGLRAGLSRQDTKAEREQYLTEKLGDGGWGLDTYGRYVVTPTGLERLGLPPQDRPVRIDEPGITRYDIADFAGEALPIAGTVAASLMAPGTGGLSLLGLGAGGAMVGKGIQEGVEYLAGENLQTFPQVAKDIGVEGLLAAGGEGLMLGGRAIGRKVMGPSASRMTDISRRALQETEDIGARASPTQITEAPIIGRAQGLLNMIFGDPLEKKNAIAIRNELNRLKVSNYPSSLSLEDVGKNVRADIGQARGKIATWADDVTTKIDDLTGGVPVISSYKLKTAARNILDELPKHKGTGKPIFVPPETQKFLTDIIEGMDPYIPVNQQFRVVDQLWKAVDDNTILPGIASHDAKVLWKAAKDSFGDVSAALPAHKRKAIRRSIGAFRRSYDRRINEFKSSLIERISRDETFANSVDPETIVGTIFSKGKHTTLKQVIKHLQPKTYDKVRQVAMRHILEGPQRPFVTRGQFGQFDVFNGDNLLKKLDSYGKPAIVAMFGKQKAGELYRLGRVAKLIGSRKGQMSGGMVAATIAVKPISHLPLLVRLNIFSKMMNSKTGMRYLTEGFEAPRTRKGMDALARLYTQAQILAEDHTQEVDLYRPEEPEIVPPSPQRVTPIDVEQMYQRQYEPGFTQVNPQRKQSLADVLVQSETPLTGL